MFALAALMLAATAAPAAPAYEPSFDPSRLKQTVAGEPGQALVLGSPHLSGFPKDFDAKALDPLLTRLAAWQPQIVTIEGLSGPDCEMLLRYKPIYPGVYDDYCWNPEPARAATGLDVPAATVEAERLLADWPAEPTAAQRRHLAAVFLAGGEQASALVQWLRLPATERRAGDGLDAVLVERLTMLTTRRNENFLIGAALAARLGLDRVYSVDDHSADATTNRVAGEAGYGEAIQRAWDNPVVKQRAAKDEALMKRLDGDGVLALYRAYNSPEAMRMAFDSDFGAALAEPSPQHYGRYYTGWWETRNLRMVANIRAAMAAQPGARALVIVGASHKGYFEAYLNMMHDIRLVDAEAVLR